MIPPLQPPDSVHLQAAQGWFELGNCVEATEELEQISPNLRGHPDVLVVRLKIYAAAGKWEYVVEVAKAISEMVPESPFGWFHLAYALHELKRTKEARAVLLPVVDKFSDEYLMIIGGIRMDQSHPSRIACLCAEAVELLPRSALLGIGVAFLLSAAAFLLFATSAAAPPMPIRGEVIIKRADSAWESQQVQEPCILPNPKDPARLVMFYSGVPASNRNVCSIGKAWALKSDPFTWHQDEHNPIFSPGKQGWDSGSIRSERSLPRLFFLGAEPLVFGCLVNIWKVAVLSFGAGWRILAPVLASSQRLQ